jgi:hypothetical protein
VLPRSIGFKAFENAMTLDIAMGGSTNTILHLLAIAQEAGIDFTMADIDRLSRSVPQLCKVAPNTRSTTSRTCTAPAASWPSWASWTVPASCTPTCPPCTRPTMKAALDQWDIACAPLRGGADLLPAGPAGIPTQKAFSQSHPLAQPGHRPRRRLHPLDRRMPSRRKAAWPCCAATSPWTAAWSRPPASTSPSWCSKARPTSPNRRTRRWSTSWPTR